MFGVMGLHPFADLPVRDSPAAWPWHERLVTVFLDDLEGRITAISPRRLEPDRRQTLPNGVRKAIHLDPNGNELGFGGPPKPDESPGS